MCMWAGCLWIFGFAHTCTVVCKMLAVTGTTLGTQDEIFKIVLLMKGQLSDDLSEMFHVLQNMGEMVLKQMYSHEQKNDLH